MALDEPVENDEIINERDITFLINKDLFNQAKPINVEFVESDMGAGFMITSALSNKGGGCGTGCSC
jgi:iron-sulfur cluster assembly protein